MTIASDTESVAAAFAERRRQLEAAELSPLAARSYPAHRARAEDDCGLRTPFQRDRDRIVHCKAFRRLTHKTQVFVAPLGDHYRTRLTHTLEVTTISRTVARALALNEDLVEAIGLGHDLGHPPFGHIGEEALDECLKERFGREFRHYEHSLRVVDRLERDGAGLNLTEQVRDGIACHSSRAPLPQTLEGRIVRVIDRVAYINHDIDDAMRAGLLREEELPERPIAVLGTTGSQRIDALVHDMVEHSARAGDIVQGRWLGRRWRSCASSCSSTCISAKRCEPSTRASRTSCASCSSTTWSTLSCCRATVSPAYPPPWSVSPPTAIRTVSRVRAACRGTMLPSA